ncbi:MAG: two-component sensor histidine kinase [Alphaproteobacteria bacterium PA2]|nr:MAG: two-component sensor histidine kinase [Alphaproteobacteria bacterium PA2]
MGLLILTLIIAQALTFVMLVMTPPPPRSIYRLEEIARALKGGDLATRAGQGLVRSSASRPPRARMPPPPWPPGEDPSLRLAGLLGVDPADVVLFVRPQAPRSLRGGPGMGPEWLPDPGRPPQHHGRHRVVQIHVMTFDGGLAANNFVAALRRADGLWTVVQPGPDPFPNEWHKRLLLWLAGCVLLTVPLSYFFARRITAPISAFARAAEALGRDPTGAILPLSGPAEIGTAARAFNDMQARLKRYIEDRTGMVGAISHDMRTPLSRIRFKLEAAPPSVKSAVLADVEQMEQMITSVLAFIRDASAGRPRERVDLRSILECLVDDAAQMGRNVSLEDGEAVTVTADSLGLARLFGNLVDNAVKYGGEARLKVSIEADEALVEIADRGPGLADSDLERVFTPFYRADSARTLDGGGVGLGLAVARSIARAHGGDVVLAASPEGLTARVRLPL